MAKGKAHSEEPKAKSGLPDLQQQVEALTQALQRERADADNIRRRHQEQIAQLKTMVKAGVVKDLLPIIDNFERALKHSPTMRHPELVSGSRTDDPEILKQVQDDVKRYDDFVKGVQGIVKQIEKTLENMGVQRIKTVGELFNPHLHEAISVEEGEGNDEIVSEELQAGYQLGDEVIRHAMVRVKR
jgi:molecular chaperone GrpE